MSKKYDKLNRLKNIFFSSAMKINYLKVMYYFVMLQAHLSIATRLGDRGAQVVACANLATTYEAIKDYDQAKSYQEQNLSIATLVNDRIAKIKALGNLGKDLHYY